MGLKRVHEWEKVGSQGLGKQTADTCEATLVLYPGNSKRGSEGSTTEAKSR